jgi:hypothetical protein
MPDNWSFVAAAYGLAAVVFIAYGRWLRRREHELTALSAGRAHSQAVRSDNSQAVRSDNTPRSRPLSKTGHPRPEPSKRPPLQ